MVKLRVPALALSGSDRAELESLSRRRKTAQALALRARIIPCCDWGLSNKAVAAQVGVDPVTVSKWRRRFLADGVDGLRDEPRSGAPRTVDDARVEAVIVRTLESLPDDATHWSSRGMAREGPVGLALDVHLVIDNSATRKTQIIRDWLAKRPRWHVHYTQPAPRGSTLPIQNPSDGPNPPTISSAQSSDSASKTCPNELPVQDNRTRPVLIASERPLIFLVFPHGLSMQVIPPDRNMR